MEKICTHCLTEKDESEFFFKDKSKGRRHSICKTCKKEIDRVSYRKGDRAKKIRNNAAAAIKRAKQFVQDIKEVNCCKRCGDERHYVLDFHHIKDKERNISKLVKSGCSLTKIKEEIIKCEILCANCHREVHYLERKGEEANLVEVLD